VSGMLCGAPHQAIVGTSLSVVHNNKAMVQCTLLSTQDSLGVANIVVLSYCVALRASSCVGRSAYLALQQLI
jgi:hypothetical protein